MGVHARFDDVRRMSSDELINLLAERGIGRLVAFGNPRGDGRRASVIESGTFTHQDLVGKSYVKILVNDDALHDYGARIWCDKAA